MTMRALAAIAGLAVLLAVPHAAAQTRLAATPSTLDSNTLQPAAGAPSFDAGPLGPPALETPDEVRPRMAIPGTRAPRGNPLWGVSLKSLTATRERPLFVPSRRPPAPPAVAGPPAVVPVQPPPPPEPDRPRLTLVGAIAGERDGIGIFVDQRTRDIVRLKTGDSHLGWVLSSVKGREATLSKDQETVLLSLPAPSDVSAPTLPSLPGLPPMRGVTGSRPNTNHGGIRDEDL
jgi:general secretion pathway protein N